MNNFLNWLLDAPSRITNPEKIQRIRLLSAILLVLLLLGTTILIIVIRHDANDIDEPEVRGAMVVMAIIAGMYIPNRMGHNRYAAGGVIIPFATVFTYIAFLPSGKAIFLAFVLMPILLTAIFFPLKWTGLISGLILATVLGFLLSLDQVSSESPFWNLRNMWFFLLLGTGLILTFMWHLNNLEEIRKQELRRINNQLEQQVAELEQFTYTVSHDLKSPIITIRGFLGFLRRDVRTNNSSRMESDIQRISEATDKMDRLMKELLELSRVGRVVNPPKEISFRDLVADALDMVQGRIMERGIEVHVQDQLPVIYGDYQRLAEVLQNLLDNAAKYMGDQTSPRVEVGSMIEGQETVFFVRDNGIGIEPQYQTRIFGLFEKLDPSTEGTGIGLALVKRIVEVHGGRVWAESKGLGHGSTFCFTVPDGGMK